MQVSSAQSNASSM